MILKTILVDDELLALKRLSLYLQKEEDLEVVGVCSSGQEAVEMIRNKRPDLVFLDIEMPGMSGFEVVEALHQESPGSLPAIIFKTAHSEFPLRAFELAAHDYLLKPTSRPRLHASIERVRARLSKKAVSQEARPTLAATPLAQTRIMVRHGDRILYIPVKSIDWIEAASNYVIIHTEGRTEIARETLLIMEKKLAAEPFLRISRSTLVQLDFVREVRTTPHGEKVALTATGLELPVTRNLRELHRRMATG